MGATLDDMVLERPEVLAAFHRALRPGGHLLLAFQVGDELLNVAAPDGRLDADGSVVALDFHRLCPDAIAQELTASGFAMTAVTVRQPRSPEKVPQAILLARKS